MKTFKQYLPESFLTELAEAPTDSNSPINGSEASSKPDPAETENGKRELNIGDPVKIVGNVEFEGTTGDVDDFGQNKHFVIVNLYNHGKHSFHTSNVEYNDYADSEEEADDNRTLRNIKQMRGFSN